MLENKSYRCIGIIKNIIICIYDLMLLFSILFFLSLPVIAFTNGGVILNNIIYQIYLLIIILLYYIWFWVKHNQTLGMKSWKTYIVNSNNSKNITIWQCMVRILVSLLGGHILLIVYKKSLQDIISGTQIVKEVD